MSTKYKILLPIGIVVLLAAGCGKSSPAPATNNSPAAQPTTQSGQNVVTYTDSGFSPASLTIKKGDTVTFKNSASDDVRVASNPHPLHTGYPTTGGCVGSTFDSCSNIAPGQSWSFKFDFTGSWGFHNHLNPAEGGTIIVQ
jgi:plastocyanin